MLMDVVKEGGWWAEGIIRRSCTEKAPRDQTMMLRWCRGRASSAKVSASKASSVKKKRRAGARAQYISQARPTNSRRSDGLAEFSLVELDRLDRPASQGQVESPASLILREGFKCCDERLVTLVRAGATGGAKLVAVCGARRGWLLAAGCWPLGVATRPPVGNGQSTVAASRGQPSTQHAAHHPPRSMPSFPPCPATRCAARPPAPAGRSTLTGPAISKSPSLAIEPTQRVWDSASACISRLMTLLLARPISPPPLCLSCTAPNRA